MFELIIGNPIVSLVIGGAVSYILGSFITPLVYKKLFKAGDNADDIIENAIKGIKDADTRNIALRAWEDLKLKLKGKSFQVKLNAYIKELKKIPGKYDDIILDAIKAFVDGLVSD